MAIGAHGQFQQIAGFAALHLARSCHPGLSRQQVHHYSQHPAATLRTCSVATIREVYYSKKKSKCNVENFSRPPQGCQNLNIPPPANGLPSPQTRPFRRGERHRNGAGKDGEGEYGGSAKPGIDPRGPRKRPRWARDSVAAISSQYFISHRRPPINHRVIRNEPALFYTPRAVAGPPLGRSDCGPWPSGGFCARINTPAASMMKMMSLASPTARPCSMAVGLCPIM